MDALLRACARRALGDALSRHARDGPVNVLGGLERGVTHFDSSAGGLGGCPFAGTGAAGNVATEDLVYLLDGLGIEHGVALGRVLDASRFIVDAVGHPLNSKVYQAGGRLATIPAPARVPLGPMEVGFIGLGKMGRPMTQRLLAAGFTVHVFNRSRAAWTRSVAEGATGRFGGAVASGPRS